MNNLTSTSFGIIIAYLLPGVFGLYTLNFYSGKIESLFFQLANQDFNFSLFLIIMLISLFIGLTINPIRWIVYERMICRKSVLDRKNFINLAQNENVLVAFKSAAEEYYRYHQFWGGSSVVLPFFAIGLFLSDWIGFRVIFIFVVLEIILIAAAKDSLKKYIDSANAILGG